MIKILNRKNKLSTIFHNDVQTKNILKNPIYNLYKKKKRKKEKNN